MTQRTPERAVGPGAPWEALAATAVARCQRLAEFSERPDALLRRAFTPAMAGAHGALRGWMEELGMEVRLDPIGNLIGRRPAAPPPGGGAASDPAVLLIGSHLDTVADAGRFDGMLGVTAGLAVVEALQDEALPFHLEVVAFCDEEGVRFGSTFFGSLALAGRFDPQLLALRDAEGHTLASALRAFGGDPANIPAAAVDPARTLGFLELHIEQGPVLEAQDEALGVAEAITGQSRLELRFEGRAAHAGTTPMRMRRDALAGAAEVVVAAEAMARAEAGAVATVGRLRCEPDIGNVVPAAATLSLDVRHRSDEVRRLLVHNLLEAAAAAAAARDLTLTHRSLLEQDTRPLDTGLSAALERLGRAPRLVSGAGHDAAVMATAVPSALLFVRSPGGVSHHPDERVLPADVGRAVATLCALVRELAAAIAPGAPGRPE